MADEKLTFDLLVNDRASAGFSAAGRSAAAASDDVLALGKRLDEVGKKSAKARVGLEGDKDADLALDKLNLKLLKLGRTVTNPKISLDGALRAAVEIKGLELEMDRLNKKAADISVSGGGLSKLGKALGGLFGAGGGGGGGAAAGGLPFIGSLSDALPALAAATPLLAALLVEADALASGFAAAGAGLGAFGLLALPTFKSIATAYTGISAAHQKYTDALAKEKQDPTAANAAGVAKALDALRVAQTNLSPSTKTAVGGIQSLVDEYHKMAAAFAPDALKVFNDALGIANTLLPDIKPFADDAGTALDGLLKKAGVFFKSADFKSWLGTFEKDVGPAIGAIGTGIGQVTISAGKLFTILSAKDVVRSINVAFDIINGVLVGTAAVIRYLMTTWDNLTARIGDDVGNVKRITGDLVKFFTSTVPTGFRLFRDEVGVVFDNVEIDVLHLALSITNTMGKLPGPLGAPFRAAHTVIAAELAGIQGDVAAAAARINADWAKLHDVNINVHGKGSFTVFQAQTGLQGKAAGGLITGGTAGRDSVVAALMPGEVVVPTSMVRAGAVDHLRGQLPGFASGGVVGSYSNGIPGLGAWMGGEAAPTAKAIEVATAAATAAALKVAQSQASTSAAAGPGGGAPAANAALAQKLYASQLTPSVWAAWNAVAMRESGWNQFARNASSGAYGIPQALPESKLPFAGQAKGGSNPTAQIGWMWNYMAGRYGGPIGAEQHEQQFGWYDRGGYLPPGPSLAYNGTGRPEAVTTEADMKAVVAELRALRAEVAKVAPGVAQGVNRGLNGLARGVVTR